MKTIGKIIMAILLSACFSAGVFAQDGSSSTVTLRAIFNAGPVTSFIVNSDIVFNHNGNPNFIAPNAGAPVNIQLACNQPWRLQLQPQSGVFTTTNPGSATATNINLDQCAFNVLVNLGGLVTAFPTPAWHYLDNIPNVRQILAGPGGGGPHDLDVDFQLGDGIGGMVATDGNVPQGTYETKIDFVLLVP